MNVIFFETNCHHLACFELSIIPFGHRWLGAACDRSFVVESGGPGAAQDLIRSSGSRTARRAAEVDLRDLTKHWEAASYLLEYHGIP